MQEVVSPKTYLAPAVPTQKIEQDLLELGFSAPQGWSLSDDIEFATTPFHSNQTNCIVSTNMSAIFSTIRSARDPLPPCLK
jgi:hypothetical protein